MNKGNNDINWYTSSDEKHSNGSLPEEKIG